MTGENRHRNDITNGQQLTIHADRPYVFYFFSTAHFLKTILSHPASGTFGFALHTKPTLRQNQKSHFFANALRKGNLNFIDHTINYITLRYQN